MREVEIAVELGSSPDFADFNASMLGRGVINIIGLLSILKEQLDVLEQRRLIGFDSEVIRQAFVIQRHCTYKKNGQTSFDISRHHQPIDTRRRRTDCSRH